MKRPLVATLLVLALVGQGACGRAVGLNPGDDAGSLGRDAASDSPDANSADADTRVAIEEVGWRVEAFEHSAFIPEDTADLEALGRCEPYLMAGAGEETWWVNGTAYDDLLGWLPTIGGMGIGLMQTRGYLSEPGTYGHMGGYQRDYTMVEWQLLPCATAAELGHCVMPREDDFCQFPEPQHGERERSLARILPGPASTWDQYELRVTYDPQMDDGTTDFVLDFALPLVNDPNSTWGLYEVAELGWIHVTEIRSWLYYQEVPYPRDVSGWIVRDVSTDTLLVSISARADDDSTVHLWGHFPVDEVIAYP